MFNHQIGAEGVDFFRKKKLRKRGPGSIKRGPECFGRKKGALGKRGPGCPGGLGPAAGGARGCVEGPGGFGGARGVSARRGRGPEVCRGPMGKFLKDFRAL